MSEDIVCFLLTPTPRGVRSLRRYSSNPAGCSDDHGYHDAATAIDEIDLRFVEGGGYFGSEDVDPFRNDPRWPWRCSCGVEFADTDERQVFIARLYTRSDTGAPVTLAAAPVGAMYFADWLDPNDKADGRGHLIVKCPGGDWDVDARSRNGAGWTRRGEAPAIIASPSILIYGRDGKSEAYHGFLGGPSGDRPGVLVRV